MPLCFYLAGFGAGTPQQEAVLKGTGNFQELKICGHGTILALTKTHTFEKRFPQPKEDAP